MRTDVFVRAFEVKILLKLVDVFLGNITGLLDTFCLLCLDGGGFGFRATFLESLEFLRFCCTHVNIVASFPVMYNIEAERLFYP